LRSSIASCTYFWRYLVNALTVDAATRTACENNARICSKVVKQAMKSKHWASETQKNPAGSTVEECWNEQIGLLFMAECFCAI